MINKYKSKEVVEAEQFLGQQMEIATVCGLDPTKICGCLMIDGPAHKVHIHVTILTGFIISPGVWVIKGSEGLDVLTNEEFINKYDQLS